ncbi:MFS general substrate transporter, partial [Violaceomyces palustris]
MEHSTPPVDDPRQWSSAKKVRVALILALMVLSFTYLSTAFALSSASLQRHFGASVEVVTLGLSLYVLGFALGPLLMGPLAQGNGKRPVYVYSWIFFSAFCFVISESDNLPVILTFRLLASIAGASALNNVPASFGDMTFPGRNAPFFCLYAVSAFAGPALGGLVGAFVDSRAGWRWNLRVQSILVTVITIISILFVPETDHPKLQRSHQSRYVAEEYNADLGPMKQGAAVGFLGTLIRSARNFCSTMVNNIRLPFSWLLTDRVVLAISIYTSLLYATIFGFFIIIPYTFATIRAFQPESVGLIYISLLIGFSLAALNYLGAQEQFNRRTREKLASATIPPETNMIHAIYGCSLAPIGLFIFAWTAPYPRESWRGPS